jgi:tRNA nucleotidyltransferase (CCA-adding enzyme)
VRRWVRRVGPDLLEDLYELNRADVLGKGKDASGDLERLAALKERVAAVLSAGAAMSVRELAIGGDDLLRELSLVPGPRIGSVLRDLLEEVIENPELNVRELLLARARELMKGKSS